MLHKRPLDLSRHDPGIRKSRVSKRELGDERERIQGINFDGSGSYVNFTDLGGISTTRCMMSIWAKLASATGGGYVMQAHESISDHPFLFITGGGTSSGVRFEVSNTGGTNQIINLYATAGAISSTTSWNHILVSIDNTTTGESFAHLVVNGNGQGSVATMTSGTAFNFGNAIGAILTVGGTATAGTIFPGEIAQVYINVYEALDMTVTGNVRKFINADGTPVYLGPGGSFPTGRRPEIFLNGNPIQFGRNRGQSVVASQTDDFVEGTRYP